MGSGSVTTTGGAVAPPPWSATVALLLTGALHPPAVCCWLPRSCKKGRRFQRCQERDLRPSIYHLLAARLLRHSFVGCHAGLVAWQLASLAVSVKTAAACCAGTRLQRRHNNSARRSAAARLAQYQRHRGPPCRCFGSCSMQPYRLAQRLSVGPASDQLLQPCKPARALLCCVLLGGVRRLCEDQYGPVVCRLVS